MPPPRRVPLAFGSGHGQAWPPIEVVSPTHCESHVVLQQYESAWQTFVTAALHPDVSLTPVTQSLCTQVPPPLELLLELLLELALVPEHDFPQIEATSPTQVASQAVLQQ